MSWDITNEASWTYKELPLGIKTLEGGVATKYETGGWRSERPIWDEDACTHCMLCWISCPDTSITTEESKMTGIDYEHCKGCGICVIECKFNALEMINEEDAKGADA